MRYRAVASNIIDMSPHEFGTSMQKSIGTSAAPTNQRPELTCLQCGLESGFGYTRLHPVAVELATCLQASRFSDAGGLARHVLKTSSKILHHLRPCRTVDTKSIEYRRRISRRRTSFASHSVASQPIQDRQVVCFGHCQKALVAATLDFDGLGGPSYH